MWPNVCAVMAACTHRLLHRSFNGLIGFLVICQVQLAYNVSYWQVKTVIDHSECSHGPAISTLQKMSNIVSRNIGVEFNDVMNHEHQVQNIQL